MKNIIRFALVFLLIVFAFVAGTMWKINKAEPKQVQGNKYEFVKPTISKTTEEPIEPIRASLPSKGLNNAEKATISLFENATPSVVFITTSNVRTDYYTRNELEYESGSGSGFVWDDNGHIITNYHVIKDADKYMVTFSSQESYEAILIGIAPGKDLAVLKVKMPEKDLKPLKVGSSFDLKVGQFVFAIGNPFGLDQTLTTGILSALGREINSVAGIPIKDVIQTDAAINPGNSGGPLLNSSGQLIGVNTAIYSPSGASAGIGFSIPVDVVKWVVPDLIKHGKLQRPTLGVYLEQPRIATQLGIKGVLIREVGKNSAAEKAGIKATYRDQNGRLHFGDIIIGINGEKIENQNDLLLTLEKYKVGEEVEVLLERESELLKVKLVLDPSN